MIAATTLHTPPPPQERETNQSITCWFISRPYRLNLIAGSFVSVELRWGGGVAGVEGGDKWGEGGGMLQSWRSKEVFVFPVVYFVHAWRRVFCWRRFSRHGLCVSTASALCLPLQHCHHWLITRQEANTRTRTHTHTHIGGERDREEQSFHKLSARKKFN